MTEGNANDKQNPDPNNNSYPKDHCRTAAGGESFPACWEQCLEVVPALTQETVTGLLQLPTGTLNDLLIGGELHAVTVGGRSPSEIISEVSNKLRRSGTIPGR
jgi:hypothetical protein